MGCVQVPSQRQHLKSDGGASRSSHLLSRVSIIIPVASDDETWRSLIADLTELETDAELLLVGVVSPSSREAASFGAARVAVPTANWLATTAGRAHQMNYGAKLSTRPFVCFLHADTRIRIGALLALEESLETHPHALHYFDVMFQDDGPRLARLNTLGVRLRSRYLGLPFGDQGLCMSRDTFQRLGEFDETAAYGEDHLLVWAAHRQRVPLQCVGAFITTSARKYHTNGWFKTTLVHGWRTWRQAIPQLIRFLWERFR